MNKDTMSGNWKQMKGKIKEKWGKLTDDEITRSEGNADELAGILQEKYGKSKEEMRDQVNSFMKTMRGESDHEKH
jgi:uncharacterized protein YjbJ (UPF0337 family)